MKLDTFWYPRTIKCTKFVEHLCFQSLKQTKTEKPGTFLNRTQTSRLSIETGSLTTSNVPPPRLHPILSIQSSKYNKRKKAEQLGVHFKPALKTEKTVHHTFSNGNCSAPPSPSPPSFLCPVEHWFCCRSTAGEIRKETWNINFFISTLHLYPLSTRGLVTTDIV